MYREERPPTDAEVELGCTCKSVAAFPQWVQHHDTMSVLHRGGCPFPAREPVEYIWVGDEDEDEDEDDYDDEPVTAGVTTSKRQPRKPELDCGCTCVRVTDHQLGHDNWSVHDTGCPYIRYAAREDQAQALEVALECWASMSARTRRDFLDYTRLSPVTADVTRACACGCGQRVLSSRPEARYASNACRVRAHRSR